MSPEDTRFGIAVVYLVTTAFGLRLHLDRPIPGLIATEGNPPEDGTISLDCLPTELATLFDEPLPPHPWHCAPHLPADEPNWQIWRVADGAYYRLLFLCGIEFLVTSNGKGVWCKRPCHYTIEDAAAFLLGPVMGFVLGLHNKVCLHSSAVVIGQRCIAIAGPSGSGKSTLAAAFACNGFPVLSDDLVVLPDSLKQHNLDIPPSYPRIRLWPDSVNMLHGRADALPRLTPGGEKCFADATQTSYEFQTAPVSLGAIYLLGERRTGGETVIEPIGAREAVIELTVNRYFPLPGKEFLASTFAVLGKVVSQIPIRKVIPGGDPGQLFHLRDAVLADYRNLGASAHVLDRTSAN